VSPAAVPGKTRLCKRPKHLLPYSSFLNLSLRSAVPGIGYFAICLDGEDNTFGLWESNEEAE
jgi:hypothetical protein